MRVGALRGSARAGQLKLGGLICVGNAVAGGAAWRVKISVEKSKRPGKLVLAAGGKPQYRARSRANWTVAKMTHFLTVLGETCNATRAAKEAGVCLSYAHKKRVSDAGFRAGWACAVATAYRRLELVLLERAFAGTEKVVIRKDGSEHRMREYSNQLGLALLKMYRDSVAETEAEISEENADEIRERLIQKLRRLKARNDQENTPDA